MKKSITNQKEIYYSRKLKGTDKYIHGCYESFTILNDKGNGLVMVILDHSELDKEKYLKINKQIDKIKELFLKHTSTFQKEYIVSLYNLYSTISERDIELLTLLE